MIYRGMCGQPVLPGDEPPNRTDAPMSAAAKGERRQIAVVFSDLSGFTAMTEQLDPEDVQGLMRIPIASRKSCPSPLARAGWLYGTACSPRKANLRASCWSFWRRNWAREALWRALAWEPRGVENTRADRGDRGLGASSTGVGLDAVN